MPLNFCFQLFEVLKLLKHQQKLFTKKFPDYNMRCKWE